MILTTDLIPNVTCTNVVIPLNKIVVDNNLAFSSESSSAQTTSATSITTVKFHGKASRRFCNYNIVKPRYTVRRTLNKPESCVN